FGTFKSRAAIKDVGRTLGFTPSETDYLAKLVPNHPNFSLTVKEAIERIPEIREFYTTRKDDSREVKERKERYRQLLDYAMKLEGLSRHAGVHAAGVVIAPGPLDEYVPICTQASKGAGASNGDEDSVVVTQYDMNALEDAGMHRGYMPGKRGEEPVKYILPGLEPVLETTYGVITYQEQVMRVAQALAGISLSEADVLRKAVGKKDAELIRIELGKFIEKSVARGHDRSVIEEIASQIETFGRYGFVKSHSVAYSIISYHTAWLKTHHPADFMAALLSSQIGDTDNVVKYINEARQLHVPGSTEPGIEILPPDVNESGYKFTVIGDTKIRFGLGAIRNVGRTA